MKQYSEMSFEERAERISRLNGIDDVLFHKITEHQEVAEEIVQVILGDKSIRIVENIPQRYLRNIEERSVILDLFCEDAAGKRISVEVQKSDTTDHLKRMRYISSNLDTREAEKGVEYEDLPDIYAIYISNFDIFKRESVVYNVDRVVRDYNIVVEDGIHHVYVNTIVNDGSEIAELMQYLKHSEGVNPKFPNTSNRINYYKHQNEGVNVMCEYTEWILNEGVSKGRAEGIELGREAGIEEAKRETAQAMKEDGMSFDKIVKFTGLTLAEIEAI